MSVWLYDFELDGVLNFHSDGIPTFIISSDLYILYPKMYTVVYTVFSLLKNGKAIHPLNELGGLLGKDNKASIH